LQIVQADRWIVDNSDAVKQNDFTKVDGMPWDSSVQALTRFPDVVQMLSDHLGWTESLGTAFSSQPEDVVNVIQILRAKAESVGNLKSTPEQEVTSREEGGESYLHRANKSGADLRTGLRFFRRFHGRFNRCSDLRHRDARRFNLEQPLGLE